MKDLRCVKGNSVCTLKFIFSKKISGNAYHNTQRYNDSKGTQSVFILSVSFQEFHPLQYIFLSLKIYGQPSCMYAVENGKEYKSLAFFLKAYAACCAHAMINLSKIDQY